MSHIIIQKINFGYVIKYKLMYTIIKKYFFSIPGTYSNEQSTTRWFKGHCCHIFVGYDIFVWER